MLCVRWSWQTGSSGVISLRQPPAEEASGWAGGMLSLHRDSVLGGSGRTRPSFHSRSHLTMSAQLGRILPRCVQPVNRRSLVDVKKPPLANRIPPGTWSYCAAMETCSGRARVASRACSGLHSRALRAWSL